MSSAVLDLTEAPSRPPLRYHGGKWRIAPWIVSLMPAHSIYVEAFGGAAGVLLRKPRSKIEVYNDLDRQVVDFFELLRDPVTRAQLIEAVALTPFSRDEFELARNTCDDKIESTRRFILRSQMGFGTSGNKPGNTNGFRAGDVKSGKSYAKEWAGVPEAIEEAARRFIGVTIENQDFRRIIPRMDSPNTLFFTDPPYPLDVRDTGNKGYVHELTDRDHEELAWILHSIKGKAMVCGYECGLNNRLYRDWRREEKATTANGRLGGVSRTEVVWMNYQS